MIVERSGPLRGNFDHLARLCKAPNTSRELLLHVLLFINFARLPCIFLSNLRYINELLLYKTEVDLRRNKRSGEFIF